MPGRTRLPLRLLLAGLLLASIGAARATDAEELALWEAVTQSNRPAEYRAYLETYPNGVFAPLARLRAEPAVVPARPGAAPAPTTQADAARAWVRVTRGAVRLVDGVTLDLDAEALINSSNLRIIVVPAATPDAIADVPRFIEDSAPVRPSRMRLTIPAGTSGHGEVRLYHIPRFADAYVVGARAGVEIAAGVPGATLARDLAREAAQIGPVRFEANHRDRPMLVQAAFLRVRPRTDWNVQWFAGQPIDEVSRQVVIVSIGQPGVVADYYGSFGEAICVLPVGDQAMLARLAVMRIGDPILVAAVPTSWGSAGPADPVLLDHCVLQP